MFRRPLGKSSRPWLYGSSSIQTIAAMAVCDTTRSTMHDCDMLSELQTVGLAGSVSIAQPIIETTVVSAGDHARLLAQLNRKFGCIWDITYRSVSSSRKLRPSSSGQPIWDTWTRVSQQHEGRLRTRDCMQSSEDFILQRVCRSCTRTCVYGCVCLRMRMCACLRSCADVASCSHLFVSKQKPCRHRKGKTERCAG